MKHFIVFGSQEWVHIPAEKRKVLEPQSKYCIFRGYPNGVKGYQLINPMTNQLIIIRSVRFKEGSSSISLDNAFNAENESVVDLTGLNSIATDPVDLTSVATDSSSTTSNDATDDD